MKPFIPKTLLSFTCFICILCLFACAEGDPIQEENLASIGSSMETTYDYQTIASRSDEECEMCTEVDACCCFVELQLPLQLTPLDLHICGVAGSTNSNESCSMDNGDGCYDVGNLGVGVVLDPNGPTRQYFCIRPGTSFSIYNASFGGTGWIRVGCKPPGTLYFGTLAFNLPGYPPSGGFTRYFQSDSNCDFEICDY